MVLVEGGLFRMGSDEFYADERPAHARELEAFRIDPFEVTNEDYMRFVDDTGYVTVAERELDAADFPAWIQPSSFLAPWCSPRRRVQ
jgi:formylglycine-generating enzyme